MIGQTISHYKIIEKLGEGGMGVVYQAQDLTLNRIVALKFLPHRVSTDISEKARFLQEAQAAAVLNHPNICTIHAIEEHEGEMFIVMECVDGVTLKQKEQAGVKYDTALQYATQIGEALQEAHSKGIVHRDVKAENVMVNSKNQIKVMDFGLAKLKGSFKITETSSTVGTLAYMAPEQIQGGEVDARSDIFSFGVLLFELLTGRLPFRGEHDAAMMYSIVNEQPEPIAKYLPEASSEFLHIFNRALEKDPEDRYQSVHDMVIDLRRLKKDTSRVSRLMPTIPHSQDPGHSARQSPEGMPRPSKKRLAILLVSGLAIVCAAVIILLLSRGPQLNPGMTFRTLQIPFRSVWYANLSKDGNWLVFPASDDHGKYDVYMMNVSQGQPRKVTNDASYSIFTVSISPDQSTVLYSRRLLQGQPQEVVSVPSVGGKGRVILEKALDVGWRPDGLRINFLATTDVGSGRQTEEFWTANPDGSDRHCEFADTIQQRGEGQVRYSWSWSPDMKSLAWTRNYTGGYTEIIVRELETGKERQLTSDKKIADDAVWTQNDQILFSSNRAGNVNLWIVPSTGGEPVQLTRGSGPDSPLWVSADCRRMIYAEAQNLGHIVLGSLVDGSVRQLTVDERLRFSPSISSSGSSIAFVATEENEYSFKRDIYVMDRGGAEIRRLTDGPDIKFNPFWSPDEKWITYGAQHPTEPPDSSRVYLITTDNPSQPRPIGGGLGAYWFNDREFMVWKSTKSYRGSIDRPDLVTIAEDSVIVAPVLDGKYVVVHDLHAARRGAWITTAQSYQSSGVKEARQLFKEIMSWPKVARDGKEVFYVELGGTRNLHRVSLPEGKDERIGWVFPGLGSDFSVRRDGKEIVYAEGYRKTRFVVIDNLFK
jgi:serine/threonine protein kinase/dipeptidyl aminopeptidase/acylaminoacyl peptidase